MLGGVAVLIARLGMRREVALYCELNAPLMSRRLAPYAAAGLRSAVAGTVHDGAQGARGVEMQMELRSGYVRKSEPGHMHAQQNVPQMCAMHSAMCACSVLSF